MKSFFKYLSLVLLIVMCLSIVSCAAKGDDVVGDAGAAPEQGESAPIVNNELNRKIVYTVRIDLEAENVSSRVDSISKKNGELGGYIESRNESFTDGKCTFATITYRVPTEKLDEFVAAIEGSGGIERKHISSEDITTTYVDAQAKKNALEERKQLLEKMLEDSTVSASDRISIINEISTVNTELQAVELLIKGYDSDVNYSTVVVSVDEPTSYTGLIVFAAIQLGIVALILILIFVSKRKRAKKALLKTE